MSDMNPPSGANQTDISLDSILEKHRHYYTMADRFSRLSDAQAKQALTHYINKEHQHQFTIPVEWKYKHKYMGGGDGYAPESKRVTKLRCICGEETDRG